MICSNCNTLNLENSKYCSECGSLLDLRSDNNTETKQRRSYKTLRILNWIFAFLIMMGLARFIFSSNGALPNIFSIMLLVFALSNYAGTAMALNPGINIILGMPIILSDENKFALKTLIVSNIILSVFGVMIVASSLATSQYLPSLSGFMYFLLSMVNIRALWTINKA